MASLKYDEDAKVDLRSLVESLGGRRASIVAHIEYIERRQRHSHDLVVDPGLSPLRACWVRPDDDHIYNILYAPLGDVDETVVLVCFSRLRQATAADPHVPDGALQLAWKRLTYHGWL